MKHIKLIILSLLATFGLATEAMAQAEKIASVTNGPTVEEVALPATDSIKASTKEEQADVKASTTEAQSDAFLPAPIALPGTAMPSFQMYGILPYNYYGYANWDLHKGFNASFGMNISVGLDSKAPSGVGFGQDAAFLYAVPLNNRLSVAGGVYASNMNWGNYNCRNVGITGIAAFKVTDRITLYGYGNKSLMPKRTFPAYPLPNYTPDKFGGMVNFKIGESASFSIGVEGIKNDYPYNYWY